MVVKEAERKRRKEEPEKRDESEEERQLIKLHSQLAAKVLLGEVKGGPVHKLAPPVLTLEEEICKKYGLPYQQGHRYENAIEKCLQDLDRDGVLLNWRILQLIDWEEAKRLAKELEDGLLRRIASVDQSGEVVKPQQTAAFLSLLNSLRLLVPLHTRIVAQLAEAGWQIGERGRLVETTSGHRRKMFKNQMIVGS